MSAPLLVGLLDSGVEAERSSVVAAARAFDLDPSGRVVVRSAQPDRLGHGRALARVILSQAPEARLIDAQVFVSSFASSPSVVAAGLDWLVAEGARLVNMSFGLREDRDILRLACAAAREAGVILLASTPARGAMVYPAGYEGVVRVTGDARLAVGQVTDFGGAPADFGACPRPLEEGQGSGRVGGASFAVAHLCGILAAYLAAEPAADRERALDHLRRIASYHGRERRRAPDGSRPYRLIG